MGCCTSTAATSSSSSSSITSINHPDPNSNAAAIASPSFASASETQAFHLAISQWQTNPSTLANWTPKQLQQERENYWTTMPVYGGNAEMWQALRAYAECEDTSTSSLLLHVANLTQLAIPGDDEDEEQAIALELPQQDVAHCYDSKGYKYIVPFYCLVSYTPSHLLASSASLVEVQPAATPNFNSTVDSSSTSRPQLRAHEMQSTPTPLFLKPNAPISTSRSLEEESATSSTNVEMKEISISNESHHLQSEASSKVASVAASATSSTASPSSSTSKLVRFKIRFSDGLGDLALSLSPSTSIQQILMVVLDRHPEWKKDHELIFFFSGYRLQNLSTQTLKSLGLKKDAILQCFVRSQPGTVLVSNENKSEADRSKHSKVDAGVESIPRENASSDPATGDKSIPRAVSLAALQAVKNELNDESISHPCDN